MFNNQHTAIKTFENGKFFFRFLYLYFWSNSNPSEVLERSMYSYFLSHLKFFDIFIMSNEIDLYSYLKILIEFYLWWHVGNHFSDKKFYFFVDV